MWFNGGSNGDRRMALEYKEKWGKEIGIERMKKLEGVKDLRVNEVERERNWGKID